MSVFEHVSLQADRMPGDAVVAFYFQDQRPLRGPAALLDWRLDGLLTRQLLDGTLRGRAGEHLVVQNNGKLQAEWTLFVGGGKWDGLGRATYEALLDHLLGIAEKAGFRELAICLAPHEDADGPTLEQIVGAKLASRSGPITHCRLSCMPLAA